MGKKLYLVRHGETQFNVEHRVQGWCDSPLTARGREQARTVGGYFEERGIAFDHAYCSTSERASDTLELMTSMPYTRLRGLKEMNFGKLEGLPDYLCAKTPEECVSYYLPFGSDSSDWVRDRMVETLTQVMSQEGHECVLAVSHGGANYNFLRAVYPPRRLSVLPCEGANYNFLRAVYPAAKEELARGWGNCLVLVFDFEDGVFSFEQAIRLE